MKYGLIGEKLGHSFSKTIHDSIADYEYELKELSDKELHSFMTAKKFTGINVTIPYKEKVMSYLDFIDEHAKNVGSVNTVINRNRMLYGYNTDFIGLKMLIEKQGFDYKDKKVVILGSGGTAKTARAVALYLGAKEVITVSRRGEVNYDNLLSLHGDCDYIINTTPCGMFPDTDEAAVDASAFRNLKGVTDVVYNPLRTKICLDCERIGIPCGCGLYMLVSQAAYAAELFTGKTLAEEKTADELYRKVLSEKRNIVLIGMPGCGKSTIGKALSEALGKEYTDTDEIIEKEHGRISDIFAEKGEKHFRDLEAVAVKSVALKNGLIIATGGGAVLKSENTDYLRANGIVIFLDRPLEKLIPTPDRPLTSDRDALKKKYEERYEIYLSSCDIKIDADASEEETVRRILEAIK